MDVRQALPQVLLSLFGPEADELAVATGFVRQPRKITGAAFARALVLTWLADADADARLTTVVGELAVADVNVTCQALHKRFSESAAAFLYALLQRACGMLLAGRAAALPVLERFTAVQIYDSTTISLPKELAPLWPGCGGRLPDSGAAALKISVGWDLLGGGLSHVSLHAARTHDRSCLPSAAALAPGTLRLTDLGYFALPALTDLTERGVFWLTRLQAGTRLRYDGRWWSQAELLAAHGPQRPGAQRALDVRVGRRAGVVACLLLERVPPEVAEQRRADLLETARVKQQAVSAERLALADWTLLLTNVPPAQLTLGEALAVYRCRWQIELLFKLWKSKAGLDESRSQRPERILCEIYAKLLAILISHWLLLLGDWRAPDSSWHKAADRIRQQAPLLSQALSYPEQFPALLRRLERILAADCRIYRRRAKPASFQRVEAAEASRDRRTG